MKQKNKMTRYFLIELIVNCFFFAVAAAICLNFFIIGHVDSKKSNDLSNATIKVQEIAEYIKAYPTDADSFIEKTGAFKTDEGYVFYYDDEWTLLNGEGNGTYQIGITNSISDDNLLYSDISVQEGDTLIYELSLAKYLENEVSGNG